MKAAYHNQLFASQVKLCSVSGSITGNDVLQGWTALHVAAFKQSPAVVELLCKHGASPNATNNKVKSYVQLQSIVDI